MSPYLRHKETWYRVQSESAFTASLLNYEGNSVKFQGMKWSLPTISAYLCMVSGDLIQWWSARNARVDTRGAGDGAN